MSEPLPLFENDEEKGAWTDIGLDHFIRFVVYKDDPRAALNVRHRRPDGRPCEGFITFKGSAWANEFSDPKVWDIVSTEPLTLTPSLLCGCKDHGHITAGKWEPC